MKEVCYEHINAKEHVTQTPIRNSDSCIYNARNSDVI